jgi:L-fucose isomerase
MHNLEETVLFRPNAWNAFGTEEVTSADYRACANFGTLYG